MCVDIISHFAPNQFEISTAKNGKEALEIILEEGPFFALITDFNMPVMSGYELINEITSRNVSLDRIIVISGNVYNESLISKLNHQGRSIFFLPKPFSSHRLVSFLAK